MLSQSYIQKVLERECGISMSDRLLLTVSGGMDSMVMLDVIGKAGYPFEVAHCNFNLRGEESDGDEQLVRSVCDESGVILHVKSFDTRKYAAEYGISIEMAARDLRYGWFNELLESRGLTAMVTAHHGDDAIETFFLNLTRGTGIRGLSGMKFKAGKIVRPFLELSRNDIEKYTDENNIRYRHDSSNDEIKYLRNKVRHEIIPVFKEMNPSFFSTMTGNLKRLAEVEDLLDNEVKHFRDESVVEEHGRILIPLVRITEHPQMSSILYELLRPYGFNSKTTGDIIKSISGIPGKQFYSKTHRLIRDRFNLILFEIKQTSDKEVYINSDVDSIEEPLKLALRTFDKPSDYSFSTDPFVAHFDADVAEFPLLLRKWKQGDSFRPLGMKGFKKLSDFFTDRKLSIADKEDVWILQSGDDIMWIAGMRIDDRFKVTPRTKNILEIVMKKD
ncbi:MAG: tRNA lysidine(34) synthetase TilS [Chlorobi bacterium]|nr:tRNA lysidine(34) synthetase TilS [Chlorobiota bacterium]